MCVCVCVWVIDTVINTVKLVYFITGNTHHLIVPLIAEQNNKLFDTFPNIFQYKTCLAIIATGHPTHTHTVISNEYTNMYMKGHVYTMNNCGSVIKPHAKKQVIVFYILPIEGTI